MHLYFLTCPKVIPANIYYKPSRFIFALQTKRIGAGGLIRRYLSGSIESEAKIMDDDNPDDISIFLYYAYILIKLLESEKK